MASLDNIYDITQKMEDTGMEYLLVVIQKGKKNGKADVFYNLKDKNSLEILAKGLQAFNTEIENKIQDDNDTE